MTNSATMQILDWLLQQQNKLQAGRHMTFAEWKRSYIEKIQGWPVPADKAVIGGLLAERMAFAFAAGFCAAVLKLVPALPPDVITSLCISEEGGAHPRGIQSRLTLTDQTEGNERIWSLSGAKKYITCAQEADLLIVAASTGITADGKNDLRMVLLNAGVRGITVKPMEEVHLVPEISHCRLFLDNVPVKDSDFLPGDGYVDYIKPFRTIEDLHMCLAILGYLLRMACLYDWPRELQAQYIGLMTALRTLAVGDPKAPAVHIAVGGVLDLIMKLIQATEPHWQAVDDDIRNEWNRDKALLSMAGNARRQRVATAWGRYGA